MKFSVHIESNAFNGDPVDLGKILSDEIGNMVMIPTEINTLVAIPRKEPLPAPVLDSDEFYDDDYVVSLNCKARSKWIENITPYGYAFHTLKVFDNNDELINFIAGLVEEKQC